jgi:hypothetical protein
LNSSSTAPVLLVFHVDEVDDDDAAEVAQAQLAGDGLRRLEIGLEDGVVEVAHADEAAGVDVDGGHRLGLVDDQVAAGLEVDAAGQRLLDFVLDAVQVEQRPLAGVVLEPGQHCGVYSSAKAVSFWKFSRESMTDARGLGIDQIAQHALAQRQVLCNSRRRARSSRALSRISAQSLRR